MEKLKKGMEFKNYKELCIYMGWSLVNGNTKIKNLKELDRICTYKREGNKYIITKGFKIPKEPPKQIGNRSLYLQPLEVLIMDFLEQNKDFNNGIMQVGKLELLEAIKLIPKDLQDAFKGKGKSPKLKIGDKKVRNRFGKIVLEEQYLKLDLDSNTFRIFKGEVISNMQQRLTSCLFNMQKRNLIIVEEITILKTTKGTKIADTKELELLETLIKQSLKELGCKSMGSVLFANKGKKFWDVIGEKLSASSIDYVYGYYKGYRIALQGSFTPYPYKTTMHTKIALNKLNKLFKGHLLERGKSIKKSRDKNHQNIIDATVRKRVVKRMKKIFDANTIEEHWNDIYEICYKEVEKDVIAYLKDKANLIDMEQWKQLINYYIKVLEDKDIEVSKDEDLSQFLKYIKYFS